MRLFSAIRSARWWLLGYPAAEYARLLESSQHWPRERLESFRNQKLQNLIEHCYAHVPYYREVMNQQNLRPNDVRAAEDLAKLPVLTKRIIRQRGAALLARNLSGMKISWAKTGGTTGEPMRVCRNSECGAFGNMCHERGIGWAGKTPDEPMVRLFGGSLGIDKMPLATKIGNRLRRELFLPAFELGSHNAAQYLRTIRGGHFRYLVGYASAIYRLAVLAHTEREPIELAAVFPTAERMLPEWEDVIRNTFKCSVLPYYGCGEVNALGYTAPQSTGYLIPEEHAVIEVMQNEQAALVGEGKFLVTDLDNYAMPIVRYENGDAGRIAGAEGSFPFHRIENLEGRFNSLLMTERGELISGVIGTHIFRFTSSVESYRILQLEPLRLVIRVVPKSQLSPEDHDLVVRLFKQHLGDRMKVTIETVPEIPASPSGKSVFVVNQCLQ